MRFLAIAALALGVGVNAQQGCVVTPMAKGNVCKCTETACDSITPLSFSSSQTVAIYETENSQNHYLTRISDQTFGSRPGFLTEVADASLVVDTSTKYQTITGFGGAFTDAAAITWSNMTSKIQSLLIDQYFSDSGLQYSLGRIPMGGSDFSTHSYSYDDVPNDFSWTHFNVSMDDQNKVPFIKAALARSSRNIKLFGSPWSPPAWMKWYGSAVGGGLNGSPTPTDPYYSAWAQYFVKFVEAYKARGINIWAVTQQNEPLTGGGSNLTAPILGTPHWDSNDMSVAVIRDFIKNNLGPALKAAHPEVNIIAWDDGNANLDQVSGILTDSGALQYINGIGVHWYGSYEDILPQFSKMNDVHNQLVSLNRKDIYILPTEACEGFLPWSPGPYPGDWTRGTTYAYDILNDLLNWGVGWTDWNLMLDMSGGPNHVGNNVDAPILLDTNAKNVFYKQPMYYALGHFAKFLPAGSVRINLQQNKATPVQSVGFLTPDGNIVIVLLNRLLVDAQTIINNGNGGYTVVKTKANSIQTVIFKAASWQVTQVASINEQDVLNPIFNIPAASSSGSSSMLSTDAIIGISIGSVALVGLLVAAGIFVKRQQHSKQAVAAVTHIQDAHPATSVDMQQL